MEDNLHKQPNKLSKIINDDKVDTEKISSKISSNDDEAVLKNKVETDNTSGKIISDKEENNEV